jgi:hypothetical protein
MHMLLAMAVRETEQEAPVMVELHVQVVIQALLIQVQLKSI